MDISSNDLAYCRERLRPWGSRPSLIVHLAPARDREPLLAILALASEWETWSRPARNPEGVPARIAWWSDELRRLTNGSPTHPVTRLFAASGLVETISLNRLDAALQGFSVTASLADSLSSDRASLLPLVGKSRGFFLEAGLLGLGPKLPEGTVEALAIADWLTTFRFRQVEPESSFLLEQAHAALLTGSAGLAPFRGEPSLWTLRVTLALARLQLETVASPSASRRPLSPRPGVAARLWTAWKAARG